MGAVLIVNVVKCFVGEAEYAEIEGDPILVKVKDCYEMLQIPTPRMDPATRQVVTDLQLAAIKCGTMTEISDSCSVIELSNDSPYYTEYVKFATGVETIHSKIHKH